MNSTWGQYPDNFILYCDKMLFSVSSHSHYFKLFSPDWLSFSLDIGILAKPAYCHLEAFIVAPGFLKALSVCGACKGWTAWILLVGYFQDLQACWPLTT